METTAEKLKDFVRLVALKKEAKTEPERIEFGEKVSEDGKRCERLVLLVHTVGYLFEEKFRILEECKIEIGDPILVPINQYKRVVKEYNITDEKLKELSVILISLG